MSARTQKAVAGDVLAHDPGHLGRWYSLRRIRARVPFHIEGASATFASHDSSCDPAPLHASPRRSTHQQYHADDGIVLATGPCADPVCLRPRTAQHAVPGKPRARVSSCRSPGIQRERCGRFPLNPSAFPQAEAPPEGPFMGPVADAGS